MNQAGEFSMPLIGPRPSDGRDYEHWDTQGQCKVRGCTATASYLHRVTPDRRLCQAHMKSLKKEFEVWNGKRVFLDFYRDDPAWDPKTKTSPRYDYE